MYGVATVLCLATETVGLRIYYAESRIAGWYHLGDDAISDDFEQSLTGWHVLNTIRLLLPIGAWIFTLTDEQVQVVARSHGLEKDRVVAMDPAGLDVPWDIHGRLGGA